MTTHSKFAIALRAEMVSRGQTQDQAADEMGVCRATVNRWVNGLRLPYSYLDTVSSYLHIPTSRLLNLIQEDGWRGKVRGGRRS